MFNVLIVEDDKNLRKLIVTCLKKNNYNTYEAINGNNADLSMEISGIKNTPTITGNGSTAHGTVIDASGNINGNDTQKTIVVKDIVNNANISGNGSVAGGININI